MVWPFLMHASKTSLWQFSRPESETWLFPRFPTLRAGNTNPRFRRSRSAILSGSIFRRFAMRSQSSFSFASDCSPSCIRLFRTSKESAVRRKVRLAAFVLPLGIRRVRAMRSTFFFRSQ